MKRILFNSLCTIILLISFFPITTAHSITLSSKVHEFKLNNGLHVLLLQRDASPTVSFSMSFSVGSVDEKSGTTGIAHMLEHMLFKGTASIGTKDFNREQKILDKINTVALSLDDERSKDSNSDPQTLKQLSDQLKKLQQEHNSLIVKNEFDAIYSRNGAAGLNASTSFDVTTFKVSLPSNRLELWAKVESERFLNPVFRQFYAERDVVLEERRQSYETKPDRMLMTRFLSSAFIAHPYGRPIIGWKDDIDSLPKKAVEEFYSSYYSPQNAVLSIVGDINVEQTKSILKKYFEKIKPGTIERTPVTKEPDQLGERRIYVEFEAEPRLIMGFHKPTIPHIDDYVFDLIDGILSGGRTSRLYKSLVLEKKLATSIFTHNGFPGARYPNLFLINAIPASSSTPEEVEKAIHEELHKLTLEPVTDKELARVKNQLKVNFVLRMQSNSGLAGMLSYYQAVCNNWKYIEKHLEVIDKITPLQITNVAEKYFKTKNRTTAYLVRK